MKYWENDIWFLIWYFIFYYVFELCIVIENFIVMFINIVLLVKKKIMMCECCEYYFDYFFNLFYLNDLWSFSLIDFYMYVDNLWWEGV